MVEQIVRELKAQRSRIVNAIRILEEDRPKAERPAYLDFKVTVPDAKTFARMSQGHYKGLSIGSGSVREVAAPSRSKAKRQVSAATKRKLSLAMKQRWAARKR